MIVGLGERNASLQAGITKLQKHEVISEMKTGRIGVSHITEKPSIL